jgi:hypothetical protein
VFEVDAEVAEVVEDGVAVELGDEVEAGSGWSLTRAFHR